MKDKIDILENEKNRLAEEKQNFAAQFEKDMGKTKAHEKEIEQEKHHQVNIKNK